MGIQTNENAGRYERRVWPLGAIEVRQGEGDGAQATIGGYAAVFGALSVVLSSWWDEFRERIERGAFAVSVAQDDVRALWNHNADFPIGRVKNGSLRLWEDAHGLAFAVTPPATQLAGDFVETIRQGYVDGMSFGFSVLDEEWDEDEQGQLIRTLKKIKLYEISPVTFPAYPQTEAQVRAITGAGFGDKPTMPVRSGRADADFNDRQWTALLEVRRRRLDLYRRLGA